MAGRGGGATSPVRASFTAMPFLPFRGFLACAPLAVSPSFLSPMAGTVVSVPLLLAACASSPASRGDTLTLDVQPRTVPCQGEAPQRCLVVRAGGDTAWKHFYDPIEGFTHEEGFRYRLEVERTVVERPLADASRYRYRLLRVISRVADTSE